MFSERVPTDWNKVISNTVNPVTSKQMARAPNAESKIAETTHRARHRAG